MSGVPQSGAPIVVCNEAHRFMVAEQLRQIGISPRATLLEPLARNTAPAIALAAHAALDGARKGEADEPILLVLAADHMIRDVRAFQAAIEVARPAARLGKLVTFGVIPDQALTGYGYIRRGARTRAGGDAVFQIAQFIEKPDLEAARSFLASGEYFWSFCSMFMFGARRYLDELARLAPDIASVCEAAFAAAKRDLDFTRIDAGLFASCRSESIDYAVMEKTLDAVVVPLDAGWSDIGSWSALHAASAADGAGNVTHGDVLIEDSTGCYLHSSSRLVAAVGLVDHIVVETKDAVLVAPKDRVQEVKKLAQ